MGTVEKKGAQIKGRDLSTLKAGPKGPKKNLGKKENFRAKKAPRKYPEGIPKGVEGAQKTFALREKTWYLNSHINESRRGQYETMCVTQ